MELKTVDSFFEALQKRDFLTMENCYQKSIQYYDPLYGYLKANEVMAMWKLCYSNLQDYSMIFNGVQNEGEGYFTVTYEFSFSADTMVKCLFRKIKSHLRVEDGLITEHSNAFSLHELSKQKNGIVGILLGWNRYYQNQMKINARKLLFKWIEENELVD